MKRNSMLLFINAALGLSLGSGISAFAGENSRSDRGTQFVQWLLLFAFVLNVVRNFLGFVKFYDDETLRNEGLVGNQESTRVYVLKELDFIFVIFNLVLLFLMGSVVSTTHEFSHYFVFSCGLFLGRDLLLWGWIPSLATNEQLIRTLGTWSVLDLVFCFTSIFLMFVSAPSRPNIVEYVSVGVVVILGLTVVDLCVNVKYYFE